jgi:D-alanine-D-alanine ligase
MAKKTVAILFGGKSVEHEISVRSARNIYENISTAHFNPVLLFVSKRGVWFNSESFDSLQPTGRELKITLDAGNPRVETINGQVVNFDVVFPVLHGTDGEDGNIQGLFTLLNIPCVGSDVESSAMSMNKLTTKRVLSAAGLPVGKYLTISENDEAKISYVEIIKKIGDPFILKPANLGSSVGVFKVKSADEYKTAYRDAFQYDHTLILETFIEGVELECAIKGNKNASATIAGEVVVKGEHEFYSYDAKYEDPEGSETIIPARIPKQHFDEIKGLCVKAYHAMGCKDYARVDLFLTNEGKVYLNEINTLPGFTDISMFPKLWEYEGVGYTDLISELIQLCLMRKAESDRLSTDFR